MKKILIVIITFFSFTLCVVALKSDFKLDLKYLSNNSNEGSLEENFDEKYQVSKKVEENIDKQIEENIINLSKKVTYLLLNEPNSKNESSKNYYKRHQDYLNLRYNPEVPKTDDPNKSILGLDSTSEEYADDILSGISVPGMFLKLDELDIKYNGIKNIRVSLKNDIYIAKVNLDNVKMKQAKQNNPDEYEIVQNNLSLYYYFKKLNEEYKLYYIFGETEDEVEEHLSSLDNQSNSFALSPVYDSQINEVYDFSKLNAISTETKQNIYNTNISNVLKLSTFYNSQIVREATGFYLENGFIITTWNYLEESLKKGQYILINDSNNNLVEFDGIVTINKEYDYAILKTKVKGNNKVTLNTNAIEVETPVFNLVNNTNGNIIMQEGIISSNTQYLENTLPLSISASGSPLFNEAGEVIGLNTSKNINSSVSLAIKGNILEELVKKLTSNDFDSVKFISFEKLKEKYFYNTNNEEIVKNNVSKRIWNKYSKEGNLKESINLKLVKANYDNKVLSLRYKNKIANFISSSELSSYYKDNLINQGYKKIVDSNSKSIYESDKYKIIITEEFDYLIIVMVKK